MATRRTQNNGHGRDKQNTRTQAADGTHGTDDRGRERRDVPGSDREVDEGQRIDASGLMLGGIGDIAARVQALTPTPEQRIQVLKRELKAMRDENKTLALHARHSRDELSQVIRYTHDLEQDRSRMQETIAGPEKESSILRRELADAKNPANMRGKESLGSQGFLTKTDTLSVSDVSESLNKLNEEIYQVAAFLGETLVAQEYPEDQRRSALTSVSEMVGLNIISMLVSESHKTVVETNDFVVQVVVQVFLVSFCTRLIEDWCPGDLEKSRAFKTMYQDIRDTEDQTIFGPWRAVTRSRTKVNPDSWQIDLLTSFDKLLVFAGWKIPSDADRTKLEGHFKLVLKAAEGLRRASGECVISTDLHVYNVPASVRFHRDFMEDVYGNANTQPSKASCPDFVIGTVGLGLKKVIREKSADGQLQSISLVSAKVALEVTLREALTESSPPTPSGPDAASSTALTTNPRPTVGGVEQSTKY